MLVNAICKKNIYERDFEGNKIGSPYFVESKVYVFKKEFNNLVINEDAPDYYYTYNKEGEVPHSLSDKFFENHFEVLSVVSNKEAEIKFILIDELKDRFEISVEVKATQKVNFDFCGATIDSRISLRYEDPFIEYTALILVYDKEDEITYCIDKISSDNETEIREMINTILKNENTYIADKVCMCGFMTNKDINVCPICNDEF